MILLLILALLAALILGGLSFLAPSGIRRWRDGNLWSLLAGSILPPVVWGSLTVPSSENPAVFGIIVALVTAVIACATLVVGLFCPPRWPKWAMALGGAVVSTAMVLGAVWYWAIV